MKKHLNRDEVSAYVAGASNPAMDEHVRQCGACRSETESLAGALSVFRDSVRNWSLDYESHTSVEPVRHKVSLRWLGWTAAATACVIAGLVLSPPLPLRHESAKPAPARQAVAAITDAELLSQVDRDLSEAVPPSMEPIALNQNRSR